MSQLIETSDNPTKKMKVDEQIENILQNFEYVELLSEDNNSKVVRILAARKRNEKSDINEACKAVIIFEKPHFSIEETKSLLDAKSPQEIQIQNDIYNKFSIFPTRPHNNVQVQLIYPATEAHIKKYSMQELFILNESYEDWINITSKYIKESSFSLQWVFNILDHKTESERILYEDTDALDGFILLPDMKWNGKEESLYMLAIVHQKNIESLRSLTGTHIKLLENIRDKSLAAIESKFGLKKHKVRAYLHYQPSFYHLHIHFAHINFTDKFQERNHQLNQVIQNLKVDSDFYKKITLECPLRKNDKLYDLYKDRFE